MAKPARLPRVSLALLAEPIECVSSGGALEELALQNLIDETI